MKYTLIIVNIFLSTCLFAQSNTDSMALYKKFVLICNAYKQLPMQLTMEYKKASTIPLNSDDSSTLLGTFYVQKGAAYIHFGDAEQIITDSLVLVVMDNIKQMVLTQSNINVADQMNKLLQSPFNDSSAIYFLKKYSINQKQLSAETAAIELTNKANFYATTIPVDQVMLTYNIVSNNLLNVVTIKRKLLPKSDTRIANYSGTTIAIPEKGQFVVKEDTTTLLYKTITHNEGVALPVTLSDRIVKDSADNYIPANAYKNFNLATH